jgi:hypothetical protein
MKTHYLKTIQPFYSELESGAKNFELRKNDRDFQLEDEVYLHEYDPKTDTYSGKFIFVIITYVLSDFIGVEPGFCIFGFRRSNAYDKETLEGIFNVCCDYYNVDPQLVLKRSRKREFVQIRQMTMKLVKRRTITSLDKIGSFLGNYDHATVLHGIKTVNNLMNTNKVFRTQFNEIERLLNNA